MQKFVALFVSLKEKQLRIDSAAEIMSVVGIEMPLNIKHYHSMKAGVHKRTYHETNVNERLHAHPEWISLGKLASNEKAI